MNLRFEPDTVDALRQESARTGRSQADIVRSAVNRYLRPAPRTSRQQIDQLIHEGLLAPRVPYRSGPPPLPPLPGGVTTASLLDAQREDRTL
jgi:hypothetical protein